ncbi:MAG TPA: serine/threonine-protein kinase [Polyangiaceae bacterium]|jgi:serine/threonine-protein kinase|nr:serine/threonine-protein kinase [Polyangiaceae bacterium]
MSSPPLETKETASPYRALFELAQGGMGKVELAQSVGAAGFRRLVAVKRMHRHMLSSREAVVRFVSEARVASNVHHANVIGIQQVGRDARGYYLVLDYVEGVGLANLVERAAAEGKRLPKKIVLRIVLDALAGLEAVHSAVDAVGKPLGILHRDVNPENMLVGRDGVSRITDFGIAKSHLAKVATQAGHLLGRLVYSAPEYLQGDDLGPELDVYALGVSLWTALVGHEPWPTDAEAQLVHRITVEGIPTLKSVGLSVAPELDALVLRACAKDRRQRFASAAEMAAAIESFARNGNGIATTTEVASIVERLAGKDLAERRERIASVVRADPVLSTIPPFSRTQAPPNIVVSEAPPETRPPGTGKFWRPVSRLSSVLAASALAFAVAGSAALFHDREHSATTSKAASLAPMPAAAAPRTFAPNVVAPAVTQVPDAPVTSPAPPLTTSAESTPVAAPKRRVANSGPSRRTAVASLPNNATSTNRAAAVAVAANGATVPVARPDGHVTPGFVLNEDLHDPFRD